MATRAPCDASTPPSLARALLRLLPLLVLALVALVSSDTSRARGDAEVAVVVTAAQHAHGLGEQVPPGDADDQALEAELDDDLDDGLDDLAEASPTAIALRGAHAPGATRARARRETWRDPSRFAIATGRTRGPPRI